MAKHRCYKDNRVEQADTAVLPCPHWAGCVFYGGELTASLDVSSGRYAEKSRISPRFTAATR